MRGLEIGIMRIQLSLAEVCLWRKKKRKKRMGNKLLKKKKRSGGIVNMNY